MRHHIGCQSICAGGRLHGSRFTVHLLKQRFCRSIVAVFQGVPIAQDQHRLAVLLHAAQIGKLVQLLHLRRGKLVVRFRQDIIQLALDLSGGKPTQNTVHFCILDGRISKIAGTNCLNRIAGGKIC